MIDVHPPHEGIHTWKDYLLHMSTIVLGLLLAIGLEQSVEALHRAHERQELRASLEWDTEKAVEDASQAEKTEKEPLLWLEGREQQIQDALKTHRSPAAPLPRAPHTSSVVPIDPAWQAARSSGLLSLLTQQKIQVYSEMDSVIAHAQAAHEAGASASRKRGQFEFRHADPQHQGGMDLSSTTPAELDHYVDLLIEEGSAWDQYRVDCEYVRGGETAIMAGERALGTC